MEVAFSFTVFIKVVLTVDGVDAKIGLLPHGLAGRDCNTGLEFSIPGFGIVEFPIPSGLA